MVKEILKQYALYNLWAHQQIIDAILALPINIQLQEVPSSFNGLKPTLQHMWSAEYIWWQRLQLVENVQPLPSEEMDMPTVTAGLLHQSTQWAQWVSNAREAALTHEFFYRNSKREQFKQPVSEVLLHMFNHATYHRGQLVTILHHLGVSKIPATDYIVFSRKKT
jgi:uncharacterized damage-inducible protein DinB